jgi:hypothetical protein
MSKLSSILISAAIATPIFAHANGDLVEDQWSRDLRQQHKGQPASTADATRATQHLGQYSDSSGDTFGSSTPALDILSLSAQFDASQLQITVNFNLTVLPCENNFGVIRPTEVSVNGSIDIDTDQDLATGISPYTDEGTGNVSGLGQDYYIDLCSYSANTQTVNVVSGPSPQQITGQASASYSGTTLSLAVPLSALGNDDGKVNLAMIAGTMSESTDLAPNGGNLVSSAIGGGQSESVPVPTLGHLGILLLSLISGIIGLAGLRKRG